MNFFANFIIYPYLIPDNISERGLISMEILPHTTWLAIVERETGFVPPSIEALIRTKLPQRPSGSCGRFLYTLHTLVGHRPF
jgi:hypothetical protein